jgi:hypothetical protein
MFLPSGADRLHTAEKELGQGSESQKEFCIGKFGKFLKNFQEFFEGTEFNTEFKI